MTNEQWGTVRNELSKTLGPNSYQSWIKPLVYAGSNDGIITFEVPTNFFGNYVSQNFGDQILYQLTTAGEAVQRVVFQVPANQTTRPLPAKPVAVAKSTQTEVPGAPLDKRFRFETFVVGKPNELAHAAARRVAEGGPVTFNPLFLYGGVGLGKTHLMHAIAHELQERKPELNVVYLSAEQFMYRFVQALREKQIGRAHV